MRYTLEEIYLLVGRDDKTAGITFWDDSPSYHLYGDHITVVFNYSQAERLEMDEAIKAPEYSRTGYVKAKYLGNTLSEDLIDKLSKEGINSEDIVEILYFMHSKPNTFHSQELRSIKTMKIPLTLEENGKDFDWMYGFTKRLIRDNIGLTPHQRAFYLGAKLYYEPDELTEEEVNEIYIEGLNMNKEIEYQYLFIKIIRKDITTEEKDKLGKLLREKHQTAFEVLNQYLNQAGSSVKLLAAANMEKLVDLFTKVAEFKDVRLNVGGAKAIYLDVHSYLHIYMRHVEEMKVNTHFEHKDNFQWKEEDVFTVIKHVIQDANNDIQQFFLEKPEGRYSCYGGMSLYFEGDYYTFHIEKDGRVSTFHKNKKH